MIFITKTTYIYITISIKIYIYLHTHTRTHITNSQYQYAKTRRFLLKEMNKTMYRSSTSSRIVLRNGNIARKNRAENINIRKWEATFFGIASSLSLVHIHGLGFWIVIKSVEHQL